MKLLILTIVLFVIQGCQLTKTNSEKDSYSLETKKKLEKKVFNSTPFDLFSLIPKQKTSQSLRIYIEGDGRAWLRRGRASGDPTPHNRLVHKLMLNDPDRDIAYIARPCQFIISKPCSKYTWTFGRYDQPVVDSVSQTIDKIKNQLGYKKIELVGYSGGATIALLIAAKRTDIEAITTVAGNLTPHYTNQYHRVTEMPTALSPLSYQSALQNIPQLHYYGSEDRVIPKAISEHYLSRLNQKQCIEIQEVDGASHGTGWAEQWNHLINKKPVCEIQRRENNGK